MSLAARVVRLTAAFRIRLATTDVIGASPYLDAGLPLRRKGRHAATPATADTEVHYLPRAVGFSSAVEITVTTPAR